MNKINTVNNGGMPVNLNDIRFIDDAVRLSFSDLLSALSAGQAVVLWGCSATPLEPEGHQISEGAIYYQGEIWHVYDHVVIYTGTPVWACYFTYDPDGNKTFKDGLQYNTYEVRKAMLCPSGVYPSNTLFTISADLVKPVIDSLLEKSAINPTLLNNTIILSGSTLMAVKNSGKATLQGQIVNPYIASNEVSVLNLPANFRPLTKLSGYFVGKVSGETTFFMLRYTLGTDGNLKIAGDEPGHSYDIDISIDFLI